MRETGENSTAKRNACKPLILATALVLVADAACANDVDAPLHQAVSDEAIAELISQLNAHDYHQRERATEALLEIGIAAQKQLEAAANSPDLEVHARATRILAIVSQQSFQRRIEAFVDDVDGSAGASLPGWNRARVRLGDTKDARQLFVSMYRAEPELLAAYDADLAGVPKLFVTRTELLYNQHNQRSRNLQYRYSVRNQLQQALSENVLALLFVGADDDVEIVLANANKFQMLFQQVWPANRVASAAQGELIRTWLANWIMLRLGTTSRGHSGITFGMQYDVPETLELALRLLRRKAKSDGYSQMYAVLCVAKFGKPNDLTYVESFLDNEMRVQEFRRRVNGKMVTYETQMRDVALAVLLHRTGQDLKPYGFNQLKMNPQYVFFPYTIVFETDADRDKALTQWSAWRAQHTIFDGEPPSPRWQFSGSDHLADAKTEPTEPEPNPAQANEVPPDAK